MRERSHRLDLNPGTARVEDRSLHAWDARTNHCATRAPTIDVLSKKNFITFFHRSVANDRYSLWKLEITHIVNAAHGRMHCQGSHDFYGAAVDYYGVPADDSPSFDLSRYFFPAAEYIQSALDTAGARVFVHCAVGVSRSASLVLAYLMIHHHYSLLEAIHKVKERRWIFPNTGFLKQLRALDVKLRMTNPLHLKDK
ncbi:dual specificity protein phosphatase 13A-like isoform X1 [Labrus mixtus]|uniref:dual specificity protein phosphatase 13A-like isoform X1 n=1 Tax=Labrus mixtus TaxID=508554 RepID=UPI0029C05760|nr:dual specificity protein phosphatase 13A-like isoform X1 [Labrus mixtus]